MLARTLAVVLTFALVPAVQAAEPLPTPGAARWKATLTIPAPEANQAAAADERYFYAIANAVVARYDRQTRERVAVSTGPAKHLNSGYFWEGKLYLTHTAYAKPEQSELKALDPATMQLTTYKDFGDFGGSITWALRHEGKWWANFARYGKENAGTFLVEFDDGWKERRRFTYPPAVIETLGSASLSGGVWLGNEILATDHDHRVIYRLKLPAEGTVLELIDRQESPFPGQGIAIDPVTKGLIGIDRAKKLIVLAELEPAKK